MKKRLLTAIAAVLLIGLGTAAAVIVLLDKDQNRKPGESAPPSETPPPSPSGKADAAPVRDRVDGALVGEFLPASASAGGEDASALVNDSGMTGTASYIHGHSTEPSDMVRVSERVSFVFDLGHMEQLGSIFIWNYNDPAALEDGLREVVVETSKNGADWTELGRYTLAPASGADGFQAAGLEGTNRLPIEGGGAAARYVRITPAEDGGNHGGSGYGLSEVRIFRYRPEAAAGGTVAAVPAKPNPNPLDEALYRYTAGAALDGTGLDALAGTDPADMTRLDKNTAWQIDLGGTYPVTALHIWNYNAAGDTASGLRDIRLFTSLDLGDWKEVSGPFSLTEGSGEPGMAAADIIALDGGAVRYLRIQPDKDTGNHGGEGYGLAALRAELGTGYCAEYAVDWTGLFSNYNDWLGADGIFSLSLDGYTAPGAENRPEARTFFAFSDTLKGTTRPVTKDYDAVSIINNSFAVMTGNDPFTARMDFTTTGGAIPLKPADASRYYWLGCPILTGGGIYHFPLLIGKGGVLGFQQVGSDLARMELTGEGLPDYGSVRYIYDEEGRLFSGEGGDIIFSGANFQNTAEAGALQPDGYLYFYGYMDVEGRHLVVARVRPEEIEELSRWRYFDGAGWSDNIRDCASLCVGVAPEVNVFEIRQGEYKGKFLLSYTRSTIGNKLAVRLGDSPCGPFGEETIVYAHSTTRTTGMDTNSYNAKAHPVLSRSDELLISYNVNTSDLSALLSNGDLYRPHFIRLKLIKSS